VRTTDKKVNAYPEGRHGVINWSDLPVLGRVESEIKIVEYPEYRRYDGKQTGCLK